MGFEEAQERARGFGVTARFQQVERDVVGGALVGALAERRSVAVNPRRRVLHGRLRCGCGRSRQCGLRCGRRLRCRAFEPVEAAVEIQILGAAGLFVLLVLLLKLFDLRAQRLHFGLQLAELIEQIQIARTHRRELLFERGQTVGGADALRRGRRGERQRENKADGKRQTSHHHDRHDLGGKDSETHHRAISKERQGAVNMRTGSIADDATCIANITSRCRRFPRGGCGPSSLRWNRCRPDALRRS